MSAAAASSAAAGTSEARARCDPDADLGEMSDNKVHPEEGQDESVPLTTNDEAAVRAYARVGSRHTLGPGTAARARARMYFVRDAQLACAVVAERATNTRLTVSSSCFARSCAGRRPVGDGLHVPDEDEPGARGLHRHHRVPAVVVEQVLRWVHHLLHREI